MITPHKTQKAYFNQNRLQKQHLICYFWGGEEENDQNMMWQSCISLELDSELTQELTKQKPLVFERIYPSRLYRFEKLFLDVTLTGLTSFMECLQLQGSY